MDISICNSKNKQDTRPIIGKSGKLPILMGVLNGRVNYGSLYRNQMSAALINWLRAGITKAVIKMITAARHKKDYGTLEQIGDCWVGHRQERFSKPPLLRIVGSKGILASDRV